MLVRFIIRNIAFIFIIVQIWDVSRSAWTEYPKIKKDGNSQSRFGCLAWQILNFAWFLIEYVINFDGGPNVLVPIVKPVLLALPAFIRYNLPDVAIVTAIVTYVLSQSDTWEKYRVPRYVWVILVLISHIAIAFTILTLLDWAFQHS